MTFQPGDLVRFIRGNVLWDVVSVGPYTIALISRGTGRPRRVYTSTAARELILITPAGDPAMNTDATTPADLPALHVDDIGPADIVTTSHGKRAVVSWIAEPDDLRQGPVRYRLLGDDDRPTGPIHTAHPDSVTMVRKAKHWTHLEVFEASVAAPELGDQHYRRAVIELRMGETAPNPGSTKWRFRGGPRGATITYTIHPAFPEVRTEGDVERQRIAQPPRV